MPNNRSAKVVVLRPTQRSVPDFNRCAARLIARGRVLSSGDCIVAYRVDSTVPTGPVLVTDRTEFVFAS